MINPATIRAVEGATKALGINGPRFLDRIVGFAGQAQKSFAFLPVSKSTIGIQPITPLASA